MEKSHKPLCMGVTYMVQQHRLNFLATRRMVGICAVPGCYLGHCCRPAGWYPIDYPRHGITLIIIVNFHRTTKLFFLRRILCEKTFRAKSYGDRQKSGTHAHGICSRHPSTDSEPI